VLTVSEIQTFKNRH